MKTNWTAADMPSQAGRSFVITGTGGLGYECGLALARAGGDVILAGRNATKGQQALNSIRAAVAGATISFELLDLASLASITAFGQRMRRTRSDLDVLINNAGVMVPPRRQMTEDGFELQIGTNYLGHFALTAHLLPLLARGTRRVSSACRASPRDKVRSTSRTSMPSAPIRQCRSILSPSSPA